MFPSKIVDGADASACANQASRHILKYTSQWSLACVATWRACGQVITTVSAVKRTRMAAKRDAADAIGRRQEECMRCRLGRKQSAIQPTKGEPQFRPGANMGWTNQFCWFQSTRTNVRSSPGGRPDQLSTVVRRLSGTLLRVEPGRRRERRFEPLEPKEIVVRITRLDQAVGVQEKPVVSAQGLFQFRVALILDKAKNQPVLLYFVHLSICAR